MNHAIVVRDSNRNIYLKVEGKPLNKPVYFKIEVFATKPEGKIKSLTIQEMVIDLSGK